MANPRLLAEFPNAIPQIISSPLATKRFIGPKNQIVQWSIDTSFLPSNAYCLVIGKQYPSPEPPFPLISTWWQLRKNPPQQVIITDNPIEHMQHALFVVQATNSAISQWIVDRTTFETTRLTNLFTLNDWMGNYLYPPII